MPKTSKKITLHEPNDMPTSAATSLIAIIQDHIHHCFNVFIGYLSARETRTSIIINIFLAFLKPVIPQLNLCEVKVNSERQIFGETFHGNFIYSQSFSQKSAERKSPKKYFLYVFCLMSGLLLEPWLYV